MTNIHTTQCHGYDLMSPNTTFVRADKSNFRTIVQKLTGLSDDSSAVKLSVTGHSRRNLKQHTASADTEMGPRKPKPFKFHERRHRKLDQIRLRHTTNRSYVVFSRDSHRSPSSSSSSSPPYPISPMYLFDSGSPRNPLLQSHLSSPPPPSEEEERTIISEKMKPRGAFPELLPLFPLRSLVDKNQRS